MTTGFGPVVLVVEDDQAVRKLVGGILETGGHLVLVAADGAEALATSAAWPGSIDLLVTDFGLGEMNGLELAARIGETRPGVAVLIISGYTELPIPPAMSGRLKADFLAKPFTTNALLQKVAQVLADHRQPQG